jgi:hypothetical protein
MAKTGPKTKYSDWMCDCICEVASIPGQYQSAMLWELGKRLGSKRPISPDTFARWRKEYPEFEDAWQQSQIISQANDEKAVMDFATGKTKGNATAFALLFNAKYREEYKPPQDNNGNTTINNNLVFDNLSLEELKYRIARSSEVLRKSGMIINQDPLLLEDEK